MYLSRINRWPLTLKKKVPILVPTSGIGQNCRYSGFSLHYYWSTDLLRGNVKRNSPQVDLAVVISAGKDEEYSRAAHTALITEPAKAEDDGALILLHHFEAGPHTDGESHNQSDDAY